MDRRYGELGEPAFGSFDAEPALGSFVAEPEHQRTTSENGITWYIPIPQAFNGFITSYGDRFGARDQRTREVV